MILSEQDVAKIIRDSKYVEGNNMLPFSFAQEIEAAVLAKLKEGQEPVHHEMVDGKCVGYYTHPSVEALDAARYRWLREQHWTDNTYAVFCRPEENSKIGAWSPSGEQLDEVIDQAMKETP